MKVLRSVLVTGLAAFAAACGDKVTVAGPPTTDTTPKVNSVTVTPSAVTMSVGQTAAFTAAVDVSNGAATTVTWSSSDASKVSVTAAGVATAVAPTPGVAICATSTADANKKGCASVVVSSVTNIPATVSIQSITVNGNINAPVNPAAVAGVIDVRANIAPGTETVQKVVVQVGSVRVDSQTFSATQSAALRYAADLAIETQSAFPPVLFSINTAAITNTTTGAVRFPNGNYNVSVLLYVAGNTSVRSTATYQTPLTFANADTYLATVATTGTTANALNAAGFRYDRGGLAISVVPVIYSGNTVAAGTVSFGSAACDASGIGTRTLALTAPASGSSAWTATFSQSAAPAGTGNLTNYEFSTTNPACTLNPIGETIAVTATNGAGDALFTAAAPANVNAVTSLRLDNRAPAAPTLVQNPNLRQNGWVNASIALNSANTGATSNGVVVTANQAAGAATCVGALVPDCGVSGIVRYVRIAASAAGLVDEARGATASNAAALPAPSAANTTYCGIWTMQDALGNESALPAAGTPCTAPAVASNTALAATHMLFGVDIAPPTIAFSGGLAANARLNGGTVGAEFQVTVSDTGIVGNSGMLSTAAVIGTVQIRRPVGATVCLVGTGATCTPASVNAAPAFPLVPTTVVAASTTVGYYFYNAFAQDAAGNQSAAVTRVIAYDPAANVPALTGALYNIPLTGGSVTFNANANDNFDLRDIRYTLGYAGGLAGPLAYPATVISAFPSASAGPAGVTGFNNSNVPVPVTIANFVRQVEDVTGNAPITVSGQYKPNALNGFLRDVANNVPAGSPIVTAIPAASVTTGVSYLTLPAPLLPRSWAITNAATNVSTGATTPAANALSVTLNADLFGPTATFNSPFARVDFYALIGGNLEQIGTTTAYTTVDDGSAFGRRHRYTLTWTPGTTSPVTGTAWVLGAQAIYAIGVNAAGDALVTPVNGNITLTNP